MIQKEYLPLLKQTKAAIEAFAENPTKKDFDEEPKLTWITILAAITGDTDLENGIEKDFYVLTKLIEEEEKEKLFETTPANISQLVEAMETGKLSQAQARERMAKYFQSLRKVYIQPKFELPQIPQTQQINTREVTIKALEANPATERQEVEKAVNVFQSINNKARIGIIIASNLANPASSLNESLFPENNIAVANQFNKYKQELTRYKNILVSGGVPKEIVDQVIPTETILLHSQYEIFSIPPNQDAIGIERSETLKNTNISNAIHTTTPAEVEKYQTVDPNILRKSGFSDNLATYVATFGNRTAIAIADKKIRESDPDVADAADLHRRKISSVTIRALSIRGTSSARLNRIAKILDRFESHYSPEVARILIIQSGTLSSTEVAALSQGTYIPQVRGFRRILLDVSQQFLGNPAADRVRGLISEKKEKIISGIESKVVGFAGRKSKGILSTLAIKASALIASKAGVIGAIGGGAIGSVFGPVGLVVGASIGAAAGGITFGAQAAGLVALGGFVTTSVIASIAVPLAIIFVLVPLFVALTLFIINSGAYVVPGGEALVGGNFGTLPTGCPAQMWPLSTNRGETYTVTQGPGGGVSHGPPNYPYQEAIDIGPTNDLGRKASVIITHPGIVKVAGVDEYGGNYVEVIDTCGGNFRTSYAHMLNLAVKVGDTVKEGSLVGQIGNTGFATNIHVHYSFLNADPGKFNGTLKSDPNRQKYPPPFMVTPYIPKTVPQFCVISQEKACRVDVP